jgi:hypothetical protein
MSVLIRGQIRQEVELIQRFADSYGPKFHELIDRLNAPAATTAVDGVAVVRLCVEAMDMLLASQSHLASLIGRACAEASSLEK